MATVEQNLSAEQKELVAVGASVGAGCHPCVDHHLKAGAKSGLDGERLLAAVSSAERVAAEAAVSMGDHVRAKLGPSVTAPTLLPQLEQALASLGAALGANDKTNIERQLRIALELGASRRQLEQAIETAHTVQENAARIHLREATRLLDSLAEPVAARGDEIASDRGGGCAAQDEPDARAAEDPEAATGGNQRQIDSGQKPPKQAKSAAVGCHHCGSEPMLRRGVSGRGSRESHGAAAKRFMTHIAMLQVDD